MNYVDALAEMIQDATNSLWRSVATMPADKLDWQTAPTARTARQLLEELVMTTTFSAELITTRKMPAMEDGGEQKGLEEMERQHREGVQRYLEAVRAFPEADLHQTIALPWGTQSFLQVIAYPYWNLVYHWGQINYIQTMYGDKDMA